MKIIDLQGGIYDQWNLNGKIAGELERYATGDLNHDKLKEIYCFCESNDSVFLYAFEPIEGSRFFIEHKYISN